MKPNKIKSSKKEEINRSMINFAPYNPRKDDPEVVKQIKKNFKKVGYLGGIVWNEKTGNLVSGHKRVQSMDEIHKYNGKQETDYLIDVEVVNLDEKTEKEQNIFMNNPSVQGVFDYQALALISGDIDFENAGLTEFQIDKMSVFAPMPLVEEPPAKKTINDLPEEERGAEIEKLKQLKKDIKNSELDKNVEAVSKHIMFVFDDEANKIAFLEQFGYNLEEHIFNGEEFAEKINLFGN